MVSDYKLVPTKRHPDGRGMSGGEILPTEKPTHICIDCGAVGRGGVYHGHGDLYAAGEIHPISDVLRWARELLAREEE